MSRLILYGWFPSPPVRAVKLTLAALELPHKFQQVNILKKEHLSEAYRKKNPQHTLPMLEDGDAFLWDSHAINSYLVSKYAKDDSLYPKDLLKRAVVDQRLFFEAGVVFANALRSIVDPLFFYGIKVIPKQRIRAVVEAYDFVETFLKDHDYIAGDHLTIADFSLISSMSSLPAFVEINAHKYPKITAWMERMEQLPYYSENGFGAGLFVKSAKLQNFTIET